MRKLYGGYMLFSYIDFFMIEVSKIIFFDGKDRLNENFFCCGDLVIKMKLIIMIYIF